jgi:hypothetical protein
MSPLPGFEISLLSWLWIPASRASRAPRNDGGEPTLRRPCSLRRGLRRCSLFPVPEKGAERREAPVRIAAPRDPPRGRAGPFGGRDRRPMTRAGAPLGAPPRRLCGSGPRFAWTARGAHRPASASSSRGGRSAARAEPRSRPSACLRGTARGRRSPLRFRIASRSAFDERGCDYCKRALARGDKFNENSLIALKSLAGARA